MSSFYQLMMRKKEEIMYATIKGTLTESPEGVFSGWSLSNYLEVQNLLTFGKNNFELKVCITPTSTNSSRIFASNDDSNSFTGIYVRNSNFAGSFYDGATRTIIDTTISYNVNTTYYAILYRSGTKIGIKVSTDDVNYTDFSQTISSSTEIVANSKFIFGKNSYNSTYIVGRIDLNRSYIKLGSTKYKLQAVVGYTVVGSPTIDENGVVSGFSADNYLQITNTLNLQDITEVVVRINLPSSALGKNKYEFILVKSDFRINCYSYATYFGASGIDVPGVGNISFGINFQPDTDYWLKYQNDGVNCSCAYSTDGINWIAGASKSASSISSSTTITYLGIRKNTNAFFDGSIYIKDCYIKANNKLWFNGQPS